MKALLTASLMAAFLPMAFAQTKAPLSDAQKQEVVELKAKAAKLTKQVGQIALNNNLQENDDAVKLLKQIADELDAIHDRLKALEDSRTTDRQDTDQNTKDIAALKKLSFNGYL